MLYIDAFNHILPKKYQAVLDQKEPNRNNTSNLSRYAETVPTLLALDARFRLMDSVEGYMQVLTLAAPPVESVASPEVAVDLCRFANDEMAELVEKYPARFAAAIAALTGFVPTITTVNAPAAIVLHLIPGYKPEEYRLVATRKGVDLTASTPQAILHGLRTLQQLVSAQGIPACTIEDRPCFAYRGAMLDVSRHFFPVEEVKTYIDLLSLHKINRFHWHLTDDQGWRIEIRSYPQLTAVGSRRAQTLVGRYSSKGPNQYDGIPYGGYYTQDDIREIVRYAAERYIEVIPEIEMPGHGLAALASYPWLGCTGGPYEVWTRWGISDDVYCA